MNKVLALIPTFNRSHYLDISVKSLLQQAVDIYIYDDGSTDDTAQVVAKLQEEYPDRISYQYSAENKGVGAARNKLLTAAKYSDPQYKYFCWMDSDDVSHLDRISRQENYLDNHPVHVVFSYMYFFQNGRAHTRTRTVHKVDVSRYTSVAGINKNMAFATAMFTRKVLGYRFPEIQRREDVHWLASMIESGIRFGCVEEPLYYCRRHKGRLTLGGKF